MKRYGPPHVIVTDILRSYGAAMKVIGNADKQETGRWLQQSSREFTLAVSTTRTGHAAVPSHAKFTEIRLRSRLRSATISTRNATSTHAPISSSTEPPLLLSGARSRCGISRQLMVIAETGSHSSDTTVFRYMILHFEKPSNNVGSQQR